MYEFDSDLTNMQAIQQKSDTAKSFQVEVLNVWQFITDASLVKDDDAMKEAEDHYKKQKIIWINYLNLKRKSRGCK